MALACGIVGLPNVGKSTLFNALTHGSAPASNYPFCTIDANVGIVPVADPRLDVIATIFQSTKRVPATVRFVDIAGLVRGASKGEGLGNQFLARIRDVDAIAMVVRCFDSPDVSHVEGEADPRTDIEIVHIELALADEAVVHRRLEKVKPRATADRSLAAEAEALAQLEDTLARGIPARAADDERVRAIARELDLLTVKPLLYVANIDETPTNATNERLDAVRRIAAERGDECIALSARLEADLAALPPEDAQAWLAETGADASALDTFVAAAYRALNLMTFFSANRNQASAWTVRRGSTAPHAAGVIHSDMERGFIRAEVVTYDDLARLGSLQAVKDAGLGRVEGRDYVMREGDVVTFRFNI